MKTRVEPQDRIMRVLTPAILGGILGIWGIVGGVGFIPGVLVGGALGYMLARWVVPGAAAVVIWWLVPTGTSTPPPRRYSAVEAMVARGDYDPAVAWYEDALTLDPDDPEPALRLARLHRDHRQAYEDAVVWFRRARDIGLTEHGELVATREIVNILDTKLDAPARSIPELARLVDRFRDNQNFAWAREDLARRRAVLRDSQSETP